jgi:hypothetical protein
MRSYANLLAVQPAQIALHGIGPVHMDLQLHHAAAVFHTG